LGFESRIEPSSENYFLDKGLLQQNVVALQHSSVTLGYTIGVAVTIALRPTPITERVAEQTAEARIHKVWPAAVVATGFVLTAAWTCLLGYGLTQLAASIF